MNHNPQFPGFDAPEQNWSKLPHQIIDALPLFSSQAELKVVLYVLRHTWGYQEFDVVKRITLDEFKNGRKRRDGTRMDNGVGMVTNSIKDGIRRAIEHGFLIRESDGRDAGRSSHLYCLNTASTSDAVSKVDTLSKADTLSEIDSQPSEIDSQPSEIDSQPSEIDPRSEKETTERNYRKRTEKETVVVDSGSSVICSIHNVEMKRRTKGTAVWYSHKTSEGEWCQGGDKDTPDKDYSLEACTSCSVISPKEYKCEHGCYRCCEECWEG
ncbi:MAG: hypothetical protein GY832_23495 [Chloroflexi bacterium]|nr:hypothetical protein [Chloroflexota bacterium]